MSNPSRRLSSPPYSNGARSPTCWAESGVAFSPGAADVGVSVSRISSTLRSLANCSNRTLRQSPAAGNVVWPSLFVSVSVWPSGVEARTDRVVASEVRMTGKSGWPMICIVPPM